MKSLRLNFVFLFWLLASANGRAASLPSGLVGVEIENIIERIGFVSTTRLMRAAEALPPWPGIRLGVDVSVAPQMGFNELGDRNGAEPQVFVLPRLHFSKGLWAGAELIFSTMPFTDQPGYSATGGILKWCFYTEKSGWLSVSTFVGYTNVSVFRNDFSGNNFEFGVYASKDYVRLKPYLGASVLLAQGSIRPALAKTAVVSSMKGTLHAFIGLELEYPVTIVAEFGLFNLNPTMSLFIGKRF